MVSVDFFTVPTIRFQVLYVFLVLAHERRRIVHFNVTAHPTAEWTAQQLREAFPFEQIPRCLLWDRDRIYGGEFTKDVKTMGIKESSVGAAIPVAACLLGTPNRHPSPRVRRPLIVLNEVSLYRHVKSFLAYYHEPRTHLFTRQGHTGTAARAPAGNRSRGCHTASWRFSPPLRTPRSLNAAVLAAIPIQGSCADSRSRQDKISFVRQSQHRFPVLLHFFWRSMARTIDLQPPCAGRLRLQMGFAVDTGRPSSPGLVRQK
jgi:hypothetical protein